MVRPYLYLFRSDKLNFVYLGLCIGLGSGIIYLFLLEHIARFKAKQQT
jgi:hypothetical protein